MADSAYKYLVIGNFFSDTLTDTVSFGGAPFASEGAYYYIDDVCVTTDSIYNETWTGVQVNSLGKSEVSIYPNPTSDILTIKSNEIIEKVDILNTMGQPIQMFETENKIFLFSTLDLSSGIYYISIKTRTRVTKSLLKIIH